MIRLTSALMLLVCGSLTLAACKKNDEPQAVPIPSAASAPVQVGSDPPPTAGTGSAAAAGTTTAATAPPPVANTAPANQAPIDSCCSALAAISKSGRPKGDKDKAATAAKICTGIAALVKSGKTQRASALAQIRSSMSGVDVPECH